MYWLLSIVADDICANNSIVSDIGAMLTLTISRMAEYREENAMIQARNMHVRDVFLENMRREREKVHFAPFLLVAARTQYVTFHHIICHITLHRMLAAHPISHPASCQIARQKANDRSEKREMWNQRLRNRSRVTTTPLSCTLRWGLLSSPSRSTFTPHRPHCHPPSYKPTRATARKFVEVAYDLVTL